MEAALVLAAVLGPGLADHQGPVVSLDTGPGQHSIVTRVTWCHVSRDLCTWTTEMRGSEANCLAQTDSTRESLSLSQVTVVPCPGPGVIWWILDGQLDTWTVTNKTKEKDSIGLYHHLQGSSAVWPSSTLVTVLTLATQGLCVTRPPSLASTTTSNTSIMPWPHVS